MKNIICSFLLVVCCSVRLQAQLQNPSFEQTGQPSLESWLDYLCDYATSENDAPPGGGQWCLKMQPGQTQGCFPGYFYQALPTVTNDQVFQLEGWAKVDVEGTLVGIYLGRKDATGMIHLLGGDTTSSESWMMLSVQDTFELETGDSAVVVINSGLVGGPIGPTHSSYFDDLHLDMVTSIAENYFEDLQLFPNPVAGSHLYIQADSSKNSIDDISVFDVSGKLVFKHPGYVNAVNVSAWSAGIYCIKLRSGAKEIVKKIAIN